MKLQEAGWALEQKDKEMARLLEQEKALHAALMSAVGENNKFKDFLLKVC